MRPSNEQWMGTRLSQDTHKLLVWYLCAPSVKWPLKGPKVRPKLSALAFALPSLDNLWRKTCRDCTIILQLKSRGWTVTECSYFVHDLSLKTSLTCFFFKFFKLLPFFFRCLLSLKKENVSVVRKKFMLLLWQICMKHFGPQLVHWDISEYYVLLLLFCFLQKRSRVLYLDLDAKRVQKIKIFLLDLVTLILF